jgi:sodium-dependent dicarboxylate transporter 2/3/5
MSEEGKGVLVWRRVGLAAGIAAFLAIGFIDSPLHHITAKDGTELGHRPARAAATAALMALWWLSEALPIHWTACVPLVFFPVLGVFGRGLSGDALKAGEPFVDAYIFLFLGGMMIGAAMEQWNLHRRVALHIMRVVGTDPKRLLLGMLIATAFVSLWISNTATAVMMLPIAMALLAQLEAASGGRKLWHFGSAITLSVAYASNVGGIGTKIGTGTNSIFCGWISNNMPRHEISFMKYIALGLPFVILFIPVVWAALWRVARRDNLGAVKGREVLDRELASMGPMSGGERKVAAVFVLAALLWMTTDLVKPHLFPHLPIPWPGFRYESKHYEADVAMVAGLALVCLRVLSFRYFRKIPWGTLVLLGGSFALAAGIDGSGLSVWMAQQLGGLQRQPLLLQLALASLATVALTAVTSNTGTVSVMLNVLPRSMAVLSACAIGASCDFALPAGTPPNAIVFGSGYIKLPTMMKTGFILDLAAAGFITIYMYCYGRFLFA